MAMLLRRVAQKADLFLPDAMWVNTEHAFSCSIEAENHASHTSLYPTFIQGTLRENVKS